MKEQPINYILNDLMTMGKSNREISAAIAAASQAELAEKDRQIKELVDMLCKKRTELEQYEIEATCESYNDPELNDLIATYKVAQG
jgi:hypothetical protein